MRRGGRIRRAGLERGRRAARARAAGRRRTPTTAPNRRSCASQSARARRDLVVGAADEVPPHDELLLERLAADQQQPGPGVARDSERPRGRCPGRAASRPTAARPRPRRHRRAAARACSKSGRSARTVAPAARHVEADERGVRSGRARSPRRTTRSPPRRQRRPSVEPAGRRGARSAAPGAAAGSGSATHSCSAVQHRACADRDCSECAMPWPAVIRLSSPGRTPRRCRGCPGDGPRPRAAS